MINLSTTNLALNFKDQVAEIRLIPPEGKPPTLDQAILEQLEQLLQEIEQSSARLVYLTSNSQKFYCVGANIAALKETNSESIVPWVKTGHRVLNRLEDLPCPVVAIVSGYVMGGGLELAMACDLIFADDSAQFAQSEARLGFIPGWGGSRRLVERIGMAKAKYYFYSGERLDSKTAFDCGLVDFSGSAEELLKYKEKFTDNIIKNNSNAISTFKRMVNAELLEQRLRNEEQEALNSKACLKDEDTLNRLDAFLNKKG